MTDMSGFPLAQDIAPNPPGIYSRNAVGAPAAGSAQPGSLSLKEMDCLRWCKEGKTNWEIGKILRISEKTVEFHLSNVMKKLGMPNRITAVVAAIKSGLIPL